MKSLDQFIETWKQDALNKPTPMKQFRVYIAAPFQLRDSGRVLRDLLEQVQIGCTSRWLEQPEEIRSDEWARNDLADVLRADALVAINPLDWQAKGTGGRHVEFGYALGLRKPIVLFGEKTNIFHHLSDIRNAATFDEVVEALVGYERASA